VNVEEYANARVKAEMSFEAYTLLVGLLTDLVDAKRDMTVELTDAEKRLLKTITFERNQ
jgi:hypothetical protein